jgi:hypothetical protein
VISNVDERVGAPQLPEPRGPLSQAIIAALTADSLEPLAVSTPEDADAFGEDLQLGLYICYELHYQGFDGVIPRLGMGTGTAASAAQVGATLRFGDTWRGCGRGRCRLGSGSGAVRDL